MGRETKILLGVLGLLAGVFVGVLSMKLFVPRPPDGAGPDVHADHDFVQSQDVVDPPTLGPRAWDFAAAPPLVSDNAATPPPPDAQAVPPAAAEPRPLVPPPAASDELLGPPPDAIAAEPPRSRFAVQPAAASAPVTATELVEPETEQAAVVPPTGGGLDPTSTRSTGAAAPPLARDPFVARTAWQEPVAAASLDAPSATPGRPPAVAGGRHTVQAGESWWSLAEQAYGDGRLYRALFAWNRVLDPRVALAPGTVLEVPPLPKLEAAWPTLMPSRAASSR
jgi:5'-nucleotidase